MLGESISSLYIFALNDDAIAASLLIFFFDIASAEPAVSARICSIKLFFLIKFEH